MRGKFPFLSWALERLTSEAVAAVKVNSDSDCHQCVMTREEDCADQMITLCSENAPLILYIFFQLLEKVCCICTLTSVQFAHTLLRKCPLRAELQHATRAPIQSPGHRGLGRGKNVHHQAVRPSDLLPALQGHHRGGLCLEGAAVGQWHRDPAPAVGHSRSVNVGLRRQSSACRSGLSRWGQESNLGKQNLLVFTLSSCQKLQIPKTTFGNKVLKRV